ncbi:DUF1254 domain-containing protein [Streptomyces sp. NBC_01724]|nr:MULTISPECIES: DUF1254 domain-containing protein [unclassified Streptomyces]WTE55955.1 DUF1254 domain-containing protein [Streptomyces sp. NBC_01620]WTE64029.1 DUF1254 domain-containing protein [Streptomyces sp. NBC_01617]WTI91313.1 DUF1254 domain-containing protein [Streptomyces sp. NBC_00724]MCX5317052.1 DUF1254 domain-containing protein [Streptomyces sp. NBC_00154]WSC49462.1 DUF1254 domain-containing protein [Streptomyces sp. NBC_01762]
MLHDYVLPGQRIVACPNQDVVHGFGLLSAADGPSVIQVPDFGDRLGHPAREPAHRFVRTARRHE